MSLQRERRQPTKESHSLGYYSRIIGLIVILEFHGMDPDVLQKSLAVLVKRGSAQVFGTEDHQGAKFF